MDFSEILKYLGDFGKFQKLIFILASIIQFFVGIHMLANVFLMGEPKHRCLIPKCDTAASQYYEYFVEFAIPNVTDDYGQLIPSLCDHYERIEDEDVCKDIAFNRSHIISCHSYIWSKSEFELTTISEFNIVCSKSWNGAFSNSFFMIGILVGSAGFGIISDRYGRKTVITLASIILLLSSTTTAFSINFEMFSCLRFITAAAICGLFQAGYVLALEFIGTSKRLVCASLVQVAFSVGELILGLLAYHIRNWKILELAISLPCIILVLHYWLLPESVRWLISKGKHDKARKVILTAAKWNKVTIPESLLMRNNVICVVSSSNN